ncbi:pyridoxamine 5'-phosphate oxidase family protein [Actinophytocola sp.]|uniref:pyridoxamine 5'-phosphate oxidase family protein n=1 Tax=Actinophytocola sp. TaxID=1872138 RepID=UPI00389AD753
MRSVRRDEALQLLASVPYGRVVFTERALPAVRPVNHIVDEGDVIVRTHTGAAILRTVGQVVAYEADVISDGPRLDWSVVVIGVVELEERPDAVARYERMLRPMVNLPMDHVLRIRPQLVNGYVLDTKDPAATT